ncbi:hypothetical protein [Streptomyces heilongjiangensis]|uniref:Epimerase n=1 Tax=Streptomyces heilongjiangensis TaxID=945052 RepID=A0ABW1BHS3_9ACTN|nr:hypothetical protein [Streptomyces heilongjiangensis]MDC2949393.1 hypothetical protein [Streptomyces heilongjiangensis]
MEEVLAYVAADLVGLWGVSHAVPTRAVVAGFGEISADSRRVLVQEWLAEAVTMWSFAALVIVVTAVGGGTSIAAAAYRVIAGALLALAVLTTLTGARTSVVWFKLCPVLLTGSAVLLLVAGLA